MAAAWFCRPPAFLPWPARCCAGGRPRARLQHAQICTSRTRGVLCDCWSHNCRRPLCCCSLHACHCTGRPRGPTSDIHIWVAGRLASFPFPLTLPTTLTVHSHRRCCGCRHADVPPAGAQRVRVPPTAGAQLALRRSSRRRQQWPLRPVVAVSGELALCVRFFPFPSFFSLCFSPRAQPAHVDMGGAPPFHQWQDLAPYLQPPQQLAPQPLLAGANNSNDCKRTGRFAGLRV